MADFLIYWKDYWEDIQNGDINFDEMWHTNQRGFFNRVKSDDSLWFVTFHNNLNSVEWRLISKIIVEKKSIDSEKEKQLGVFGRKRESQKFEVKSQPDLTSILCKLEFESGKKITSEGRIIGQKIQKIRPLSETDSILLENYKKKLKTE